MLTRDRSRRARRRAGPMDDSVVETLIASYAGGDLRVLGPLFDLLAPRLLGFFERCVGDREMAEQYAKATFIQLHHVRHAYRSGTPVRPWVFGIAARVRVDGRSCLDRLNPGERLLVAPGDRPGETSRDRQVRLAIEGLAIRERVPFHLHRYERMSFEEIAGVLGSTEAAVRCEVLHAYRELRARLWTLGDDGEEP